MEDAERSVASVVVEEQHRPNAVCGQLLEFDALEGLVVVLRVGLHDEADLRIFRGGEAVHAEGVEETVPHVRFVTSGQVEDGNASLVNRPGERERPGEGGVVDLVRVRQEPRRPELVELGGERAQRFRVGFGLRAAPEGVPERLDEVVPDVRDSQRDQPLTHPRETDDLFGELVDDAKLPGPIVHQRSVDVEDDNRRDAIGLMRLGSLDGRFEHIIDLGDLVTGRGRLHLTLACG